MDKRKLLVGLALPAIAFALVTSYVTGTISGKVWQAIILDSCEADKGTCEIAGDKLSFTWSMDGVYQGSTYHANVTLKNLGNGDIEVDPEVVNITATGGNEEFEGSVTIEPDTLTVPAEGTAKFTITVTIHDAEEPGEEYQIDVDVKPVSAGE